jgi:protein involved in polysaccharide export with SLBB domain
VSQASTNEHVSSIVNASTSHPRARTFFELTPMTDSTIMIGSPRPSLLRTIAGLICAALVIANFGCARAPYVWAKDIPAERAKPDARARPIQPGDTIAVTVTGQERLSIQHVVGSDGTIALPDVGTVSIGGQTVSAAEAAVTKRLTAILAAPKVSVVLLTRSIEVTLLGEVRTPGKYNLKVGDGVASALALGGGLTEFADEDAVFLIRSTERYRIRFRMDDLVRGGDSARAFALRDGDLLVVE